MRINQFTAASPTWPHKSMNVCFYMDWFPVT